MMGYYNLQSVAGYLGLTLVLVWGSAPREGFNGYLRGFLASTNKFFILAGGPSTTLSFFEV